MRAMAETTVRTPSKTWPPPQLVLLPENRSAWLAVRRLAAALAADSGRCPFNPLVLHGPPGTGKTLLANALHERVAADRTVTRITAADWLGHDEDAAPDDVRDCDLLIVEDLQHLRETAAAGLTAVLDHRLRRRQLTLVTATHGPAGWLHLPARLVSRLAGGLVVALPPLSPASRRQFLRAIARQRKLAVSEDVLACVARQTPGSARQLAAALSKLETLTAVAPDVPSVMEHFDGADRGPTLERIARHVGRHYRIEVKELRGRDRHPQTRWPRQVSMYLARELTELSLAQIGEYFGRDHSTVRHACQRVAELAGDDAELPGLLQQLAAELA